MEDKLQVARHELKYYISYADYIYAKSILSKLMVRDSYQKNDTGYFIRSLYFDDIYESSVEEKIAGVEKRDKYRLRIYYFDQNWAKLERKRKDGNYVIKSTAILSKEEALEMTKGNYESLFQKKDSQLDSIYFDLKSKYLKPVVIVDYMRDAYMMDYNNIRITFDKCLRYNDTNLNLYDSNVLTQPLQRDDIIIMEVKFNNFLPPWFNTLLRLESATSSAISKYCQSRIKAVDYYFT